MDSSFQLNPLTSPILVSLVNNESDDKIFRFGLKVDFDDESFRCISESEKHPGKTKNKTVTNSNNFLPIIIIFPPKMMLLNNILHKTKCQEKRSTRRFMRHKVDFIP